ncbi:Metallophosphoesterase [Hexamita inflata]|uniref:Metallophosphoesterase n=1 Tax=Hexamita inflata TaxID=28002 RepID=A0AA86UC39_9EUKA|nr:Metallophosphoesterase [Hexamita inflata]
MNLFKCCNKTDETKNLIEDDNIINITFISDTHEQHKLVSNDLVPGDIIVHTGDFSNEESGSQNMKPVKQFLDWFSKLPYQHKIFIGGNHDVALQNTTKFTKLLKNYPNITYLNQASTQISLKTQNLKFYGVPFVTRPQGMFYLNQQEQEKALQQIEQCDILLSHNMPYRHDLFEKRVDELKPRIHAFGHMHGDSGICQRHETLYINAAMVGHPGHIYKYKPIQVSITKEDVKVNNIENIKVWNEFPKK